MAGLAWAAATVAGLSLTSGRLIDAGRARAGLLVAAAPLLAAWAFGPPALATAEAAILAWGLLAAVLPFSRN